MISKRAIAAMGQAQRPIPHSIAFMGGWDQITPPLSMAPGFVRSSQNFECDVNGGYSRIIGFERYDGRTSPSDGRGYLINITLTGTISVGDTVTDVTSAATGVVVASTSSYIIVTKVVGTFGLHVLNVGGLPQATATSTAQINGGSTVLLRAQYRNAAADSYRSDISASTGSGDSLGGIRLNNVLYTWRANAGGTAVNIWKSTTAGWVQVTLYNEISFTVGAVAIPAEGATLTQGGVTSTLKRLVLTSGTFAGGNAAGRFIITNPAGGNFAAGAATLTGGVTCTLSAIQTAINLSVGGRYEIIKANFGGSTNTLRAYGCDGVNRGFEFDGSVYVPITTGMTSDAPNHVYSHKNHLIFSFLASFQHAAPGTPYVWSVVIGAAEIAMGDTIDGFQTQPGSETVGALAIFTRNQTSILYGTGVANWNLTAYRSELGAYAYTVQDMGQTTFLDDQGVTTLQTAQAYGNFAHNAISNRVKTYLSSKRSLAVASCVSRNKSQYRLFFSDGDALFFTFDGRKLIGAMKVNFPHPVTWVDSSEDSDGTEVIFFGSTNGMVYQMEKGTSFDGDAIGYSLSLAWDFLGSPRTIKRFIDCMLEISGNGYAAFSFNYLLGYGSTNIAQPTAQTEETNFSEAIWNQVTWNQFFWNGSTLSPSIIDMGGEGENVSLSIRGSSDYHESIKISGAVIHYSPRRELR